MTTNGRIVCSPDFVAMLTVNVISCLLLGEEDRDTKWANAVIARKAPGYRKVFATNYHLHHFAGCFDVVPKAFRILFVTPAPTRRNALLRNALKILKDDSAEFRSLWRFASKSGPEALTADSFLHGKIWYRLDSDEPGPLVTVPTPTDTPPQLTASMTTSLVLEGQANGQPRNNSC